MNPHTEALGKEAAAIPHQRSKKIGSQKNEDGLIAEADAAR
jgi:hypothetical protein